MPKAQKEAGKKDMEVNKILIENFVSLQKVMTNLAGKFDSLSDQISRLLQLFEISARSFARKQQEPEHFDRAKELRDKEFADKVDKLLEQNKIIAKGITLIEEKVGQHSQPQPPHNIVKDYEAINNPEHQQETFRPRELPRI